MKIICFVILAILILFSSDLESQEFRIIASINGSIITEHDLKKEIKFQNSLNKKFLNSNIYLQKLIEEKIKSFEIKKNNITIDNKIIYKQFNEFVKRLDKKEVNKELENYIFKQIENSLKWNKLILLKFKNKVEINMTEINKNILDKKIPHEDKEKYIRSEENKKINIISKTYFNEIKRKYLIKKHI